MIIYGNFLELPLLYYPALYSYRTLVNQVLELPEMLLKYRWNYQRIVDSQQC